MSAHVDEVVDALTLRMIRSVETYERSARDDTGRQMLRSNVEGIVGLFLGVLAQRRRLTAVERQRVQEVGAARAAAGFLLAPIQEGVHVAIDEGRVFLYRALSGIGDHRIALAATTNVERLVHHFAFDIQRAIEAGFWDVLGERMISDSRARDIRVRRALEGALDGQPFDASQLSSLDGASELTVVAIRAVDPGVDLEAISSTVARSLANGCEGPVLFTAPVLHAVLILGSSRGRDQRAGDHDLARALGVELLTEPAKAIAAVPRAYRFLRELLELVPPVPGGGCIAAEGLLHLPLVFASPRERQVEYVRRTLEGVFIGSQSPAIAVEGLRALLAYYDSSGAQAKQAALALGIPLGTVKNRLKRVEQLTGCSKDGDRLRLELAVRMWNRLRDQAPEPGDPEWLNSGAP